MAKLMDLTGDRYGRLTVLKEVDRSGYIRRWLCQCDCGSDPIIVRMSNLRTGHTTSCGCVQAEKASEANGDDLSGQRFGKLVVQQRSDKKSKSNKIYWDCLCDCGKKATVEGTKLRISETQSCGCLRSEKGEAVQKYNQETQFVDGVFVPLLKSKLRSDNTSGIKGVMPIRRKSGKVVYRASIAVNGIRHHLGDHDSMAAAAAARKAGEEKYHKPYLEVDNKDE